VSATADVVVIGAGVIGSSVAYGLARRGLRIVVVDKGGVVGHGSTSASSAIVRFSYSTFDGVAISWESLNYWNDWADHLEAKSGSALATLRNTGIVTLDAPAIPRDRSIRLYEQVEVPYEEWDTRELRNRVPSLDTGRYGPPRAIDDDEFLADASGQLGALYTPDGGFIDDPTLATQNLAEAATRQGVRFLFKRTVEKIHRAGGRVSGVSFADGDRIDAPVVVNCAGPWSSQVNAIAGVGSDFTISVRQMRQEVHHVDAPPGYNNGERLGPVVSDLDLGIYVRPALGNVMYVGGTEPECDPLEWLDDPDAVNPNRTASWFERNVIRAARRFPELRIPSQPKGIAGIYDVSSDWTPIYDRTELDGFYVAMGTSGNQFKNAPVVGKMMANLIAAVEDGRDHDASPLQYDCEHTGHVLNMAAFSRKRPINADSTGTVMG